MGSRQSGSRATAVIPSDPIDVDDTAARSTPHRPRQRASVRSGSPTCPQPASHYWATARVITPAATVRFVFSSTRMNDPVSRFCW
jgi:hypothetical protein